MSWISTMTFSSVDWSTLSVCCTSMAHLRLILLSDCQSRRHLARACSATSRFSTASSMVVLRRDSFVGSSQLDRSFMGEDRPKDLTVAARTCHAHV